MEKQGNEDSPRRRGRSRYPKEFRRDAAALVIDQHRTVADVARQLGVVEQTLGNWVRQERIDRGEREGLSSEDRARISEQPQVIPRRPLRGNEPPEHPEESKRHSHRCHARVTGWPIAENTPSSVTTRSTSIAQLTQARPYWISSQRTINISGDST